MFNYYINEELIESYPKATPREFEFGETHYIEVIDGVEDESTKVINNKTSVSDYPNYDYKKSRISRYGSANQQLEYIAENGVMSFKNRQMAVKARYPKNET